MSAVLERKHTNPTSAGFLLLFFGGTTDASLGSRLEKLALPVVKQTEKQNHCVPPESPLRNCIDYQVPLEAKTHKK